jgi:hypothetical protein
VRCWFSSPPLGDGFREVVVQSTHDLIQPPPIIGQRLEDDGAAVTPNPDRLALKAKLSRKSHGLRSAGPEELRRLHRNTSDLCRANYLAAQGITGTVLIELAGEPLMIFELIAT